ncbi:MAG: hypothetical protein C5B49_15725 [Bdellovibrio sp.]|nr:MAG: hypothetical protein C5B49_15725 [Bdellovibrio sp.]
MKYMDGRMFQIGKVLCVMSLVMSLAISTTALVPPVAFGQDAIRFPEGFISLSERQEFSPYFFAVDKKRRILRVYENEGGLPKILLESPSDMGKKDGDKSKENDRRTPVGIYFLQSKLAPPEIPFNLYGKMAFTTDYPNVFDRRDDKTGSGIWLHAVPDFVALTRGSRGCVVVRNDVIEKLEKYVRLGQTPMVIFDEIAEVEPQEYLQERDRFLNFVETWRAAWQNEDVDTYIKFYDPTFATKDMNYRQWYRHKRRLKGLYKSIEVTLSKPLIIHNRDQVVIRLLQSYRSDRHEDFGEKTIHARYSPETGFRIIREDWEILPRPADWPTAVIPVRKAANTAPSTQ